MTFEPAEALRRAGLIEGAVPAELAHFYQSLTKEETDTLISLKNRLMASVRGSEVVAHSEDWTKPEATEQGLDAAMMCACGAWSGSGTNPNKPS